MEFPMETGARSSTSSKRRRSALERIAEPDLRLSLSGGRSRGLELSQADNANSPSVQNRRQIEATDGSSSAPRIPATLRLQETEVPLDSVNITIPAKTGTTVKRRVTSSRKKVARSPLQGVKVRKPATSKTQKTARKRLCPEHDPNLPCDKAGPSIIPKSKLHKLQYPNYFSVPPEGTSGGLSLMWKEGIDLTVTDFSPNLIDTKITYKGVASCISFIYGAPAAGNRPAFWAKLSEA
ncbi:hypothetical protein Rs2_29247 [Raphanus sativus]|nr:hypothetical protein Rs2_29247 [Raphanus sativus]